MTPLQVAQTMRMVKDQTWRRVQLLWSSFPKSYLSRFLEIDMMVTRSSDNNKDLIRKISLDSNVMSCNDEYRITKLKAITISDYVWREEKKYNADA